MKTQRRIIRMATAFVITTGVLLQLSPHPALAKKSGDAPFLDGQVVNVGGGKPNGMVHLRGRVRAAGDLDLSAVKLHLISFLSEPRGSLELVSAEGGSPLVPLHLAASEGSSATEAVFESKSSPGGPKVQVALARVPNTDEYDFSIKVHHVLIAADPACFGPGGTTERRTRLSLTDGVHSPVQLHIRHLWQCGKNRLTNPSPVEPLLGGGVPDTPEGFLVDMGFSLAQSIAGAAVTTTLFPYPSIDYATLIEDFEEVVKEALLDNDILQDSNTINGILLALNELERDYAGGESACEVLVDAGGVDEQLSNLNIFIGRFEGYGQAGLSGWVSAAQALLNALRFKQQLKNDPQITNCTTSDLASDADLAANLDSFVQYLVAQRNAVLHQNILDSLHDCHKYSDSPPLWEFKNCTGTIHDGITSHSSCESEALAVESTYCAETTLDDQTNENSGDDGNVAWMDEVIDNWRDALAALSSPDANGNPQLPPTALPCATCQDALAAITVGGMLTSVRAEVPVDTTAWVKAACDGKQTCDYQLHPINFAQATDGQVSSNALTSVKVIYQCGSDPTQHVASLANVGDPTSALYDGAYLHLDCAPRVTNFQATVKNQPVAVGVSDVDVSTHSPLDAGKITDGTVADPGHDAKDTNYVIVLPHTQSAGALVIDLGAVVQVCGNGSQCLSGPTVQADNDDVYQLDYSTDGVNWTKYGQFPTISGSGLRTRGIATITSGVQNPPFSARYVRVFGVSGGPTFSVSEISLWNTGSQLISLGKPASSNFAPLITNGIFAPPGTSWNNSTYAIVLQSEGPAYGLAIDLGQIYGALDRVKVQAENEAYYQVDVSTDGATWFNWYSVPPVPASGLQTRDSGPLPPSAGRYVRVYATRGDNEASVYSVSEVQVFANQAMSTCNGERVCGRSAVTVLKGSPGATAQDVAAHWTCGSDPTPYTILGVPWTVSRSGFSYADSVVQPSCPPTTVTCTDPNNFPTKCSNFAKDATNDVVYMNAANISYQLSNDHPSCESVISGKTNFYHTNSGTKNDPACTNVQRAIHDAIAEGLCPPGIGADANTSWMAWPYNVGIGGGSTATSLVDPALGQPPLLLFLGCNSLLR